MPKEATAFLDHLSLINSQYNVSGMISDRESKEYGACSFKINNFSILFRKSKKTPKKVGMFVTLWKRNAKSLTTEAFDENDDIDFVVIHSQDDIHKGYFIFPKMVFVKQGIFSKNNKGGKRAMRLYSPYHVTESDQALKSKAWQSGYYYDSLTPNSGLKNLLPC
jgi:hypothetical protein